MPFVVPVSPIPLLTDPPFVFALFLLAGAIGRRVLLWLRADTSVTTTAEKIAVAGALGTGVLQYVCFLLGVTGLLNRTAVIICLALLAVAFARDLLAILRSLPRLVQRVKKIPLTPAAWILLGMTAMLLGIAFFGALAPVTDHDGQFHHLTALKRWFQSGRMRYLPTFTMSLWPMGVQMVMGLGFASVSDTAAKFIHFAFGILAVVSIFALGKRLFGAFIGCLVAFLFVSSNLGEFQWAYVDLGITLQITSALVAWSIWLRTKDRGWLVVSALGAGFATSFKLTGFIVGVSLALLTLYEMRKSGPSARAAALASAALVFSLSLLPVTPWLIRSFAITGNPVYPMLSRVIPSRDWSPERTENFDKFFKLYNWGRSRPQWGDDVRQKVRLAAVGLVLLATAAGVLLRRRQPEDAYLIFFTGLGTATVFWLTGPYGRYLLPLTPVLYLSILSPGARWISRQNLAQYALTLVLLLLFLRSLPGHSSQVIPHFLASTGSIDRETHLRAAIPSWDMVGFINANVPDDRPILLLGELSYYIDNYCFISPPQFQGHIRFEDWETFLSDVQRHGIEYVHLSENPPSPYDAVLARMSAANGNERPFIERLVREYGERKYAAAGDVLYHLPRLLETEVNGIPAAR